MGQTQNKATDGLVTMSEQPMYPYRDTSGNQQGQPQAPGYGGGGQAYGQACGQQPQQPQAQPYWQQPQQAPGANGAATPYGQQQAPFGQAPGFVPQAQPGQWAGAYPVPQQRKPSRGVAIAAMSVGVVAALVALAGYDSPTRPLFVAVALFSVIALALGVIGMATGRSGGRGFGYGLAGAILGAFAMVMFVTLSTARVGSISAILATDEWHDEEDAGGLPGWDDDDWQSSGGQGGGSQPLPSSAATLQDALSGGTWVGIIDQTPGVEEQGACYMVEMMTDGDWFAWTDTEDLVDELRTGGRLSVSLGDNAEARALECGFSKADADAVAAEASVFSLADAQAELVCLEMRPDDDTLAMRAGRDCVWFGYVMHMEETQNLDAYTAMSLRRVGDTRGQEFVLE